MKKIILMFGVIAFTLIGTFSKPTVVKADVFYYGEDWSGPIGVFVCHCPIAIHDCECFYMWD